VEKLEVEIEESRLFFSWGVDQGHGRGRKNYSIYYLHVRGESVPYKGKKHDKPLFRIDENPKTGE